MLFSEVFSFFLPEEIVTVSRTKIFETLECYHLLLLLIFHEGLTCLGTERVVSAQEFDHLLHVFL